MGFVATFLKNFLFLIGGFSSYNNDGSNSSIPELIPRTVLYGNPDVTHVRIDSEGRNLAFLKPRNEVLNIWIQPVEEALRGESTARPLTNDTGRGIRSFSWSYLPNILFYTQDKDGDENYRLYKLNVEREIPELLTDTDGVRVQLIASHRDFPQTLYIGLNDRDPRHHDIYRMNVTSGEKELFFLNTEGYSSFIFDHKLKLRLATKEASDAGTDYFVPLLDPTFGNITDFKLYRHVSFEDDLTTGPAGFDKTNTKLYWTESDGRDLSALVIRDVDSPDVVDVIYEPKKTDVTGVMIHPVDYTPLSVVENYRKPKRIFLNDTIKEDFRFLQDLDRNAYIEIVDFSEDYRKWVVALTYDNKGFSYYFYDRDTRKTAFLFTNRPALHKYRLTKMYAVEVTTRDNYSEVCYVSLPLENDPLGTGHPLKSGPLIMLVHGGPNARDYWGYDRSVQLMANRGYSVMQCNFRGSTGYGKNFINIAEGEWGGKMHYDIIDAAEWAVQQGFANPEQIAIYGGSYGGYAALAGLTFTPEFFKCAVDIVGPSNLITMLESIPPYWEVFRKSDERRVGGNPSTEEGRTFLKSRSPLFFADRITKPLLIAHGANDPRVKKAESDQIFQAMKANRIPVTYLLFPNEGHGFARPENKIAFVTQAEKFLAECLGGRAESEGTDSEGTTLQIVH